MIVYSFNYFVALSKEKWIGRRKKKMKATETSLYGYYGEESTPFLEKLHLAEDKRKQFSWDWRVSTIDIEAVRGELEVQSPNGDLHHLIPTKWAHGQIAEKTGIRKEYYDRIKTESVTAKDKMDIYGANLNYWFHNYPKVVLVRQFEKELIGFLSDKYRIIDNYDVAMIVLKGVADKMKQTGHQMRMKHAYVTQMSMSYTVYDEDSEVTIPGKPDEKYWLGLSIKNSEVGYTAFQVAPLVVRKVCSNGLIRENPYVKRHIGSRGTEGDIWSEKTKTVESELVMNQVKDMVDYALDKEKVQTYLNKLGSLSDIPIDPTAVEASAIAFKITQDEAEAIMSALERNTAFDYVQSMSAYANSVMMNSDNPERATELQKIAGSAVDDRDIWKMLEKGRGKDTQVS